jgi:hypothetical protein
MAALNAVSVGMGFLPAALEVFTADEAGVNVEMRQRNGTKFLEVEIQEMSVYSVEVRTVPAANVH